MSIALALEFVVLGLDVVPAAAAVLRMYGAKQASMVRTL